MFAAATTHLGPVSIVCPAAGIAEPVWSNFWYPPGSPESRDEVDGGGYKLFDINLTHPVRVTQMAISHFLASDEKQFVDRATSASVASQIATVMFSHVCGEQARDSSVRALHGGSRDEGDQSDGGGSGVSQDADVDGESDDECGVGGG